jgi:competence protein ComEC
MLSENKEPPTRRLLSTPQKEVPGSSSAEPKGELPEGKGELPEGKGELPEGKGELPEGKGELPEGKGELPEPEGGELLMERARRGARAFCLAIEVKCWPGS